MFVKQRLKTTQIYVIMDLRVYEMQLEPFSLQYRIFQVIEGNLKLAH